jgi:hypothetical protein
MRGQADVPGRGNYLAQPAVTTHESKWRNSQPLLRLPIGPEAARRARSATQLEGSPRRSPDDWSRRRADIANRRWTSRRPAFQWSPAIGEGSAQSRLPTFPTRNTRTQSGNWPRTEAFSRRTIEQPLPTVSAPRRSRAFPASAQSLQAPARGRRGLRWDGRWIGGAW